MIKPRNKCGTLGSPGDGNGTLFLALDAFWRVEEKNFSSGALMSADRRIAIAQIKQVFIKLGNFLTNESPSASGFLQLILPVNLKRCWHGVVKDLFR